MGEDLAYHYRDGRLDTDRARNAMDSKVRPQRIAELLRTGTFDVPVRVNGWVRTRRDSKAGFSFLEVNDGSCQRSVQVVALSDLANYDSDVKRITTGCAVSIVGTVVASPGREQGIEIRASEVIVHGWADASFPLQKKRHTLDYLRTIGHLRPRTNTFGCITRVRSHLARAIHDYFAAEGFFYLHTPIITSSDAEGAGEMFQVTTLDADHSPRTPDGRVDHDKDFFGRKTHLTVSGQLEAEVYAMSLGAVYTFGPTFRAENSNTTRHLAEFWMVEPEVAFNDLDANAVLAESFLKSVVTSALAHCDEDLAWLDKNMEGAAGTVASLQSMVSAPFERLTYTDAVKLLIASGQPWEHPVTWGVGLQTEHERWLTEVALKRPVILTDYPAEIAAFYMRLNDDGKTVRNMDVLVPGIGEIIGGSQREERYDTLATRMASLGLSTEDYGWYLELRKYGTAPHAGFGLGFERLVQFVTGVGNIRDVIPFPRTPRHADF